MKTLLIIHRKLVMESCGTDLIQWDDLHLPHFLNKASRHHSVDMRSLHASAGLVNV